MSEYIKPIHINPSFKKNFLEYRFLKKLAVATIFDALGFKLARKEFEKTLITDYSIWIDRDINKKSKKKIINKRLRILFHTCNDSDKIFESNNLWFDILGIDSIHFLKAAGKFEDDFKLELTISKDIDKINRKYHKILNKIDTIQFI